MTALEKAARALCVLDGHDPDGPVCDIYIHDDPHAGKPWASYRRQARAVLMAVREVDNATGWVGAGIIQGPVGGSAYTAATDCFAGMIDAILSQP